MAEGLLKQHIGTSIFVQSAGVKGDMEIDGFAITVCREVGVELSRHRTRSFDDLMEILMIATFILEYRPHEDPLSI